LIDISNGNVILGALEISPALEPILHTLENIIAASAEAVREAFELGRNVGRTEASADLRAKIDDLLSAGQNAPAAPSSDRSAVSSDGRATQGSVKPTIARMIAESGTDGLTAGKIIDITGFKPNSVRGTLWGLGHDGSIVKRAGRWYPAISRVDDEDEL
jgi:hypothetical protein